jgi:oxygen-independent coproporphyrinogen-3 oxidase
VPELASPLPAAPPGTPLYVHLPFCAAKCHYCDFFSVPDEGQDVPGMVEAILVEARARAPRAPRTVFLGGGTPSLLSVEQLRHFLEELQAVTGFRESAVEVTAECNPESLDEEKARALLDLGVRRLSIGLQSLDDATLELFGRVHSAESGLRAYDAARAAGAEDVNVDMIHSVPGQTAEGWSAQLARVLDLEPDHLSAYNLTFEEDTRFRRWLDQGRLTQLPEEVELACFALTRELCVGAGLPAYEVSNHARPGRECRHNLGYWRNEAYVGLGPSAVSKVGHRRAGNRKGIQAYLRAMAADGHATDWDEELDPPRRLGETWWLGLRTSSGVDPAAARRTAGFDAEPDPALPEAERMVASGHLEHVGDRYRLTELGLPVADAVARTFLTRLT